MIVVSREASSAASRAVRQEGQSPGLDGQSVTDPQTAFDQSVTDLCGEPTLCVERRHAACARRGDRLTVDPVLHIGSREDFLVGPFASAAGSGQT